LKRRLFELQTDIRREGRVKEWIFGMGIHEMGFAALLVYLPVASARRQ